MRRFCIILLFTSSIFTTKVFAQDYGNKVDPLKLCIAIQSNNFISDAEAENALDRILSVIGASKRFVLQPCDNIDNAVAVSYKGVRYILYDKEFMNSVSSGNNWSNLFILAHEVGHHINGHSLDLVLYATEAVEAGTLASRRQQELEADEFAGFILGKLGASLPQTNLAVNLLATNSDDTYSSHPTKSKRLDAISSGFLRGTGNVIEGIESTATKTAFEYWHSAYEKYKNEDFYGAITDYTSAISINPKYGGAYSDRGSAKVKLKDFYGAIADFNLAIEIDPRDDNSIWDRGYAKYQLKDYYGAISDFTNAIIIDPKRPYAFYFRGKSKALLNDHNGAISDFNKGIEIEPNDDFSYFGRGYSKFELGDFYGAISDYNKVIELVPNLSEAYYNRSSAKLRLKDYSGACKDARIAKELGNNLADEIINKSCY
jgi:tetratricopeptide (TPR) repeat protein